MCRIFFSSKKIDNFTTTIIKQTQYIAITRTFNYSSRCSLVNMTKLKKTANSDWKLTLYSCPYYKSEFVLLWGETTTGWFALKELHLYVGLSSVPLLK